MGDVTNKLTVYLIKDKYSDFQDIVIEGVQGEFIEGVGAFYAAPSIPRPPDWLAKFFKTKAPDFVHMLSSSARGLLLKVIEEGGKKYTFALTFGHGRHLLRDDVVEDRFGLKVVLNSVYPNSLRSIDKINLGGYGKQSPEQMGRESEAAIFGIDIEQDLLKAVTGRSRISEFGRMISGKMRSPRRQSTI